MRFMLLTLLLAVAPLLVSASSSSRSASTEQADDTFPPSPPRPAPRVRTLTKGANLDECSKYSGTFRGLLCVLFVPFRNSPEQSEIKLVKYIQEDPDSYTELINQTPVNVELNSNSYYYKILSVLKTESESDSAIQKIFEIEKWTEGGLRELMNIDWRYIGTEMSQFVASTLIRETEKIGVNSPLARLMCKSDGVFRDLTAIDYITRCFSHFAVQQNDLISRNDKYLMETISFLLTNEKLSSLRTDTVGKLMRLFERKLRNNKNALYKAMKHSSIVRVQSMPNHQVWETAFNNLRSRAFDELANKYLLNGGRKLKRCSGSLLIQKPKFWKDHAEIDGLRQVHRKTEPNGLFSCELADLKKFVKNRTEYIYQDRVAEKRLRLISEKYIDKDDQMDFAIHALRLLADQVDKLVIPEQ